eukprot:8331052-Pyramimonas_sp.AAC.1
MFDEQSDSESAPLGKKPAAAPKSTLKRRPSAAAAGPDGAADAEPPRKRPAAAVAEDMLFQSKFTSNVQCPSHV